MNELSYHISPGERLNCDGKPFGQDLATSLNFLVPDKLSAETRETISTLRYGIDTLKKSSLTSDEDSVETISYYFKTNDYFVLKEELPELRVSSNILGWLGRASYRDFARFAIWNTERQQLFQRSLERDQPDFIADTQQKTERLINIDFFPKQAKTRIQAAIGAYGTFHAMDSFEAGAMHAGGYCDDSTIALANEYMSTDSMQYITSDMRKTVFHEYLHGAGIQAGAGFLHGLTTRTIHRWLEESFVSHAAQVAQDIRQPDMQTINPEARERSSIDRPYIYERKMLAYLLSEDASSVPIDLLAAAFFSEQDSSERNEVEKRFTKFFTRISPKSTEDALHSFSQQYETAYNNGTQTKLLSEMIHQIHGHIKEPSAFESDDNLVSIDELID